MHNVRNMLMKIYASIKVIFMFASIYLNNVIEMQLLFTSNFFFAFNNSWSYKNETQQTHKKNMYNETKNKNERT
jgi:hypothetical protein